MRSGSRSAPAPTPPPTTSARSSATPCSPAARSPAGFAERRTPVRPDEALELLADGQSEAGTVEVQRKDETVAKLGPGDVIGEAGVVRHALCNATVVATSPLRALVIANSDIKQVRREHPDFDKRLQAVMEERIG